MSDESSFEIVNKRAEIETSENEKSSLINNWSANMAQTKLPTFVPVSNSSTGSTNSSRSMFHPTKFSPAIPESKAASEYPEKEENISNEDDLFGTGGLFDWVKDTVGNRGSTLLTKVAEKAKNSMGSVITALDPQMREMIGGVSGIEVIVTSERENEISPIREVFEETFNRPLVKGLEPELSHAKQVVGFKAAAQIANLKAEKIKDLNPTKRLIISIQNFIVEIEEEKWYDLDLLTLTDFEKPLVLQTYSQMTPVPYSVVNCVKEDTPENYPNKDTGFAVSVAQIMASNLQVYPTEWHEALTGVSRKDKILNAAKVLSALYKNTLLP